MTKEQANKIIEQEIINKFKSYNREDLILEINFPEEEGFEEVEINIGNVNGEWSYGDVVNYKNIDLKE